MKRFAVFLAASMTVQLAIGGLAIYSRYPGVVNFKLLVTETLIDGRQIQTPTVSTKLLKGK